METLLNETLFKRWTSKFNCKLRNYNSEKENQQDQKTGIGERKLVCQKACELVLRSDLE